MCIKCIIGLTWSQCMRMIRWVACTSQCIFSILPRKTRKKAQTKQSSVLLLSWVINVCRANTDKVKGKERERERIYTTDTRTLAARSVLSYNQNMDCNLYVYTVCYSDYLGLKYTYTWHGHSDEKFLIYFFVFIISPFVRSIESDGYKSLNRL